MDVVQEWRMQRVEFRGAGSTVRLLTGNADGSCYYRPSPIRPSQPVIITANDRRAAVLNLEHAGIYSIYCFAPRSGENEITLTIEHPGALRLSHYQRNGDPRALALSFRRIKILPLVEPAPQLTLDRVAHVQIGGKVAPEMIAQTERATGVTVHDLLTDFEMLAGDCMFGFITHVWVRSSWAAAICRRDPIGCNEGIGECI